MNRHGEQARQDLKLDLRRNMRSRRRQIPAHLRNRYDDAIRQNVVHLAKNHTVSSMAVYWPFDGEPDIIPICMPLVNQGIQIVLPVVSESVNHSMAFHLWNADTVLKRNRYNIYEPQQTGMVSLSNIDMLLMPLVAYDHCGNRVGMGSGFYDRCLEKLHHSQTPLRVGVAYSLQEIAPFKKDDWDIPLHGLVNENGWFTFENDINK